MKYVGGTLVAWYLCTMMGMHLPLWFWFLPAIAYVVGWGLASGVVFLNKIL